MRVEIPINIISKATTMPHLYSTIIRNTLRKVMLLSTGYPTTYIDYNSSGAAPLAQP